MGWLEDETGEIITDSFDDIIFDEEGPGALIELTTGIFTGVITTHEYNGIIT